LELFQQPFARQHSFERDQNVAAEAFDPAIINSAKPVRVSTLSLEITEQASINPSSNHFVSVLQRE
jgi:predicted ATPase